MTQNTHNLTISKIYEDYLNFNYKSYHKNQLIENFDYETHIGLFNQAERIINKNQLNLRMVKRDYNKVILLDESGKKYDNTLKEMFYSIKLNKRLNTNQRMIVTDKFLQIPVCLQVIEYNPYESIQIKLLNEFICKQEKQTRLLNYISWGVWLYWIFTLITILIILF